MVVNQSNQQEPGSAGRNQIRVLDDLTIDKISAGEVVERPQSVVKELVDNAIDAGATVIDLEIINGGRDLICVTDNGCGLTRDQALLAFERHATSKITSAADLNTISTSGFRGEALAAIAAVSKIELVSKMQAAKAGARVVIEGGILRVAEHTQASAGTKLSVKKIFYNTPARRKFLRTANTEKAQIVHWFKHNAIIFPEISFRLFADQQLVLNYPAVDARATDPRARSIFWRATEIFPTAEVELNQDLAGIQLAAKFTTAEKAVNSSKEVCLFVNKRIVKDPLILKAIKSAYGMSLKSGIYPSGFLALSCDPADVDQNVHPQKTSVRFKHPQQVFNLINQNLAQALANHRRPRSQPGNNLDDLRQSLCADRTKQGGPTNHDLLAPSAKTFIQQQAALRNQPVSFVQEQSPAMDFPAADGAEPEPGDNSRNERFTYCDLKYLNPIFKTYLLCQSTVEEKLYIIDFHAAHERFNFEKIKAEIKERSLVSQLMLKPEIIHLQEASLNNLEGALPLLEQSGFGLDICDGHIVLKALPAFLIKTSIKSLDIKNLLVEIATNSYSEQTVVERYLEYVAARLACHASKRAGDYLSANAVYALFANLDTVQNNYICPHGRPIAVGIGKAQLSDMFGR